MREILINTQDNEHSLIKIKYPTLEDIESHKVIFENHEGKVPTDKILLFSQEWGTLDTNAYFSMIAYLKEGKILLFTEYDNPEHSSFAREFLDETDYQNFEHTIDFYKEAVAIVLEEQLEHKPANKKMKI